MTKQKKIGEIHNLNVCEALKKKLQGQGLIDYCKPVQLTVEAILRKFPNIKQVAGRYDCANPDDEPSLRLILETNEVVKVNLFSMQSRGKIQPKNPGVKSFIAKYFQSEGTQQKFNEFVDEARLNFFRAVIETKADLDIYTNKEDDLPKQVKQLYPFFTPEINPIRTSFLFQLREYLFELLLQENAIPTSGLEAGAKELLLVDSTTFVTYYNEKDEMKIVEEWRPELDLSEKVQLYKKGNDTVGIRIGQIGLTLRLKFESSPISSLKLATSFDRFPVENERQQINKKSLQNFKKLLNEKSLYNSKTTEANAVGKCHEALIYAGFVEKHNAIYQIDKDEYINLLKGHAPKVKEQVIKDLQASASTTVDEIEHYLVDKYQNYELESVQLVPQSYLKDALNTTDIQLTIKVRGLPVMVDFSLKAISKPGGRVTMKNPGIGKILGSQYFGVGTMKDIVNEVKERYCAGQFNHKESLQEVSRMLGLRLQNASQQQLQKGLAAIFGSAPTVVTFYTTNHCTIKQHKRITSKINVQAQSPTLINTTLSWEEGKEDLRLRVKFSKSQSYGWSSLKLVGEYGVK